MNFLLSKTHKKLHPFKDGLHIGHKSINLSKKKYWHPLMATYLVGIRNRTALLNPHLLRKCMLRAFYVLAFILQKQGNVLIVNTNPDSFKCSNNLSLLTLQNTLNFENNDSGSIYKKFKKLKTSNISYCSFKWIGGTLTNWRQLSKSVLTFAKFSQRCESFLLKNSLDFPRYKKVKTCFHGFLKKKGNQTLLAFYEKPDIIFLVNPNENSTMIAEANKLHIPIIAFVESNTNLQGITYPIPCNMYSLSFFYFCMRKIIVFSLLSSQKENTFSSLRK